MIVTYYSYKGGVGRSMALANLAVLLSRAELEVVVIDWDLDAPGIEHFFAQDDADIARMRDHKGLIDLLCDYKALIQQPIDAQTSDSSPLLPTLATYLQTMTLPTVPDGRLKLLSAGQRTATTFKQYIQRVRQFDWEEFYRVWEGERFFEWMRRELEGPTRQRIVLIDSRTGITEIGNVCTYQLADIVVMLSAANMQSIEGTRHMARSFSATRLVNMRHNGKLEVMVIPARIEPTDPASIQRTAKQFLDAFADLDTVFDHTQAWQFRIPYIPSYAYNERLMLELAEDVTDEPTLRDAYYRIGLMLTAIIGRPVYNQLLSAIKRMYPGFALGPLATQRHMIYQEFLAAVEARETQRQALTRALILRRATAEKAPPFLALYAPSRVGMGVRPIGDPMSTSLYKGSHYVLDVVRDTASLIVLGEPGYGKSALLSYLALRLSDSVQQNSATDTQQQLPAELCDLIPVPISCRLLANDLQPDSPEHDFVAMVWSVIEQCYDQVGLSNALEHAAHAGRVLWLFDGLDEVPHEHAHSLLRMCKHLVQIFPRTRIIVTSRTTFYQQLRSNVPTPWRTATLLPFAEDEQKQFLRGYVTCLAPQSGDAALLSQRMVTQMHENISLRRLATNPLLFTMMTMIYYHDGRMLDYPANLYEHALGLLLYNWRTTDASLRKQLSLDWWNDAKTGQLLDRLGYEAIFIEGKKRGGAVSIPKEHAYKVAADYISMQSYDRPTNVASLGVSACSYLSEMSNGVFQGDEEHAFRFLHATVAQYLAARWLATDEHWHGEEATFALRVEKHLSHSHWCDVVPMAAGYLIHHNQSRPVFELIDRLQQYQSASTASAYHVNLVIADLILELHHERLIRLTRGHLVDDAYDRLRSLVHQYTPEAHDAERSNLLQRLLELADIRYHDPLEIEWCTIPAGTCVIGSDPDAPLARTHAAEPFPPLFETETPQRTITLSAFRIARNPVSQALWQFYLRHTQGETAEGEIAKPFGEAAVTVVHRSQPVTNISWHEAMAFCRWLSAQKGLPISLPSEEQWEYAARGSDGRIYPWGNEWRDGYANTREAGFGMATPPAVFPHGASPAGVEDMVGNIYEWTQSQWNGDHISTSPAYVVRGGAWDTSAGLARCAARGARAADERECNVGFRIVTERVL